MLPSRRELNFCKIAFFKLYAETPQKSSKKAMDFEVKIEKNREKNVSKKYVFFDCVFLSILGGFGEGFGRGLEPLGASWATFWRLFLMLVFGMLSKRALGGSWARFWLDFEGSGEGFGEGFGRVLRQFGGSKIVVLLDRVF